MEKKVLKSLAANTKAIKVMGQGCGDDCRHEDLDYSNGRREPINFTVCYRDVCAKKVWYDGFWNPWA